MVELRGDDSLIEEPEGTGEDEKPLDSDYPIDRVLIRNENRTVYDVLNRIRQDRYIMDPDFQRDFVWDESKQSKLIESVLMRIPLPVFYLAEDEEGRMVVVDGLQRLSTFRRFIEGGSRLRLGERADLNGKRFKDLPPRLQNRIEDCNLIVYIIDPKVPERMKLDIFERVNSGVRLTRQQMRNALHNGKGTRFLRSEAHTDLFKTVTGGSLRTDTMRDRKFVNRFCAFHLLGEGEYRGDMDKFLADAIIHMNKLDDRELEELGTLFRNGLRNNYQVFRRNAFRRITRDSRISAINAPLWDVMVAGLSHRDASLVTSRRDALYSGFIELLEDRDFFNAITRDINTRSAVRRRFSRSRLMFRRVFGD